jgi:hypothetical protein
VDLAHVLASAGRREEALSARSEARELYNLKGDVVSAARLDAVIAAETDSAQPLRM